MAFEKITDADLEGKGVVGQPDVPGLPASEMQEKMEEIVRSVVIPAFNNMIDEIVTTLATKEELARIVIQAGAVTSVFGRAGEVTAQSGDYTAAMVGAAPAQHKNQHKTNGSDPLSASDIGAAAQNHNHGNITKDGYIGDVNGKLLMTGLNGLIVALTKAEAQVADRVHAHGNVTNDGKVGSTSGKVLMTGTDGAIEAKTKTEAGIDPTVTTGTQTTLSVTLSDNTEYVYSGVHALTLNAGTGYGETWGQITFNSTANPTVTLSGFTNVSGDDYTAIAANETWEFSCKRKTLLWKKVSA